MPRPLPEEYWAALNLFRQQRNSDALSALDAVSRAHADDRLLAALVAGNKGLAHLNLGNFKEAEQLLRTAVAQLEDTEDSEPISHAQFLRHLVEACGRQHRHAETIDAARTLQSFAGLVTDRIPTLREAIDLQVAHALLVSSMSRAALDNVHGAYEDLVAARTTYRSQRRTKDFGYAECLTNLAHVQIKLGRKLDAELSLNEAAEITWEIGNVDQFWRVIFQFARLGSPELFGGNLPSLIRTAAYAARDEGRIAFAHLRLLSGAQIVAENGDVPLALEMLSEAKSLVDDLSSGDPHRPMHFYEEALLRHSAGLELDRRIPFLIEGAGSWLDLVNRRLEPADLINFCSAIHEHFRLLMRCLLDEGRITEAVVAFEVGQALAQCVALDPRYLPKLRSAGFSLEEGAVSTKLLERFQANLADDQAALILVVSIPEILAFCIFRSGIEVARVPVSRSRALPMISEIIRLPVSLGEGVGSTCFPLEVIKLLSDVATYLMGRRLVLVNPHAAFHNVPWRAVLRDAGMDWRQLSAPTVANALLGLGSSDTPLPRTAIALGYGQACGLDFGEEARDFVAPFGTSGEVRSPCDARQVTRALTENAIVLLSCHGHAVTTAQGVKLRMQLQGGDAFLEDIAPDEIGSPLVILSACSSGVYGLESGDYPTGGAPMLLRRGAQYCLAMRFPVDATFARALIRDLGSALYAGESIQDALASSLHAAELRGENLWRYLACVELFSRG